MASEPDPITSPVKDRVARSVFWMTWPRGLVQAISFFAAIIIARILDPTDYGLMALVGVWTSTIALLAELGLGPAIVQFRDLEERELNACFWLVMGMAVLGYLVLYASAPAMATWFGAPLLAPVLRVAGLSLFFAAARTVPDSLLRKRLELDKISQAEIVAVVATTSVVLSLAWSGAGVWALVAGTLVMPLTQAVASFWFMRWWPGLRLGSHRVVPILRYSVAALGARITWAAYQQVDAVVLGRVAGGAALGFYSMAKALATVAVDKVTVVASHLASPIFAGLQTDRVAMRNAFLHGLRLIACVTVPVCVGTALVADDLVPIVLGSKWAPIVPLLQVLCLFGLVRSLDALLPSVLFARYRPAFLFWWTAALLFVMPFAFWAGAVAFGALGVAVALVLIYPIMTARLAHEILAELGLDWKGLWHQVRPAVRAAVVMAVCVLLVRWSIPGSDWLSSVTRLAMACSVGALVYGLSIFWWGGAVAGELTEVATWLFRIPSGPVAEPARLESEPV